jgi:hypothetical protein
LRRVIHHLSRSRIRAKSDFGVADHVHIGRLDGSPVLALASNFQPAREALSACYAIRTLRVIRRRVRIAEIAGTTVNALSTRERLRTWLPELCSAIRAAQAHALGAWAVTLTTQLEYCIALADLVATLRNQNPSPARCIGGTPSWWISTASAVEMLHAFAGAPHSRQAFRPLLARWHVLRREGEATTNDQQRSGDALHWDAVDTYVLANARFGTPAHKVWARECLRSVGIGRPDLDDDCWHEYIQPHECAGLDFYRAALGICAEHVALGDPHRLQPVPPRSIRREVEAAGPSVDSPGAL